MIFIGVVFGALADDFTFCIINTWREWNNRKGNGVCRWSFMAMISPSSSSSSCVPSSPPPPPPPFHPPSSSSLFFSLCFFFFFFFFFFFLERLPAAFKVTHHTRNKIKQTRVSISTYSAIAASVETGQFPWPRGRFLCFRAFDSIRPPYVR